MEIYLLLKVKNVTLWKAEQNHSSPFKRMYHRIWLFMQCNRSLFLMDINLFMCLINSMRTASEWCWILVGSDWDQVFRGIYGKVGKGSEKRISYHVGFDYIYMYVQIIGSNLIYYTVENGSHICKLSLHCRLNWRPKINLMGYNFRQTILLKGFGI